VNGILILENAGGRIATKYFDSDLATKEAQLTFEEQLTEKVAAMPQGGPDALLFRDYVVMYKCYQDFRVFVVGTLDENELLLTTVLTTLCDTIRSLLKKELTSQLLTEHFDVVLLAMDDIVDDGMLLDLDADAIVAREAQRELASDDQSVEHSLASALALARDQFLKSMRS